jgi:hypothetical protein
MSSIFSPNLIFFKNPRGFGKEISGKILKNRNFALFTHQLSNYLHGGSGKCCQILLTNEKYIHFFVHYYLRKHAKILLSIYLSLIRILSEII